MAHETAGSVGHVVEANGMNFYYQAHGRGRPLILLHAGTLSGDMWQPYLDDLADRYRVVVPDMPGHGRSGSPEGTFSYRKFADAVVAFIEALDLDKPLIVGFSDGGQVALEIGIRHPALPQAIVLGGVLFKYSDALRAFVRSAVGDESSPDADVTLLARNHRDWAAWLDHIYGRDGWHTLLGRLKPMWTTPLNYTAAEFAKVVAPALVLVGDRDELVPVEEAVEMYRQLPNGELAVVPGADHGAFFSARVGAFQPVVADFLRRHSG